MTVLGEDVYTDEKAPDAESLKAEGMLIEMAIRAMWAVPGKCQFSYDHARAALESLGIPLSVLAAIRAGTWKAVPVEPSLAQCEAVYQVSAIAGASYHAMLSAAPKTPKNAHD